MKRHTGASLKLIEVDNLDVKCFPDLFPDGKYGWDFERNIKLTKQEYLRNRILNSDRRCATSMAYLCFAIGCVEQLEINAIKATFIRKCYKDLTVGNVKNLIRNGQKGNFAAQVIIIFEIHK